MALQGEDRLERVPREDMEGLGLTPQELFLMSRVDDAKPTVDDLIRESGLPAKQVKDSLARLVDLELVRRIRVQRRVPTGSHDAAAASVANRHARRLRAALQGGRVDSRPATRPDSRPAEAEGAPEPRPEAERSGAHMVLPEPGSALETPMVDERDPRLDADLDLPMERQRAVLGIYDKLGTVNHFELLGITPTNDVGAIRRAYHKLSRRFHPDAYYGKNIGDFRVVLEELFKAARASHDLLISSEKRDAYVERLLEIERHKMQVAEAKSREADRRREMREALERQRIEALEAKRNEAARREREERDRRRKAKMHSRLVGREARESKAREHIRAAEAELRADNYGAAAGLFRLAMDLVPERADYHERWTKTLTEANRRRAHVALENARGLVERGNEVEAAHFFEEAARAEPTAINQARAAAYLALRGDGKAVDRARGALEVLRKGEDEATAEELAEIHVLCAEAYMRLGQLHTAKTQLEAAKDYDPRHPRLTILLKKLKVG